MRTILTMLLAGAAGAGLLTGCLVHRHHGHAHHGYTGVEVRIPAGHYHDHYCGHYHYQDRWYHHSHHRHGPGCGHVFIGGRWTLRL